jgi:hypothetical protein
MVCTSSLPEFAEGATVGRLMTVSAAKGSPVTVIARDGSLTLLGLCTAGGGPPTDVPTLQDGERVLRPAGGALQTIDDKTTAFLIYPPTEGRQLSILRDTPIATAEFPDVSAAACLYKNSEQIDWLACGSIDVIAIHTRLPFKATQFRAFNASILDGSDEGAQLGFYQFGAIDGEDGLITTVGFQRPTHHDISIQLREAIMLDGSVNELRIDPIRTELIATP